jgi:hypothetical protein
MTRGIREVNRARFAEEPQPVSRPLKIEDQGRSLGGNVFVEEAVGSVPGLGCGRFEEHVRTGVAGERVPGSLVDVLGELGSERAQRGVDRLDLLGGNRGVLGADVQQQRSVD